MDVVEEGDYKLYLSLHCHHQNDSCIKMGRDESHFNVSVGSDGQSHKTIPQTTTFFKGKEIRSPGLMGIDESHFMCRVAGSEEMCVYVSVCVCVGGGGGGGLGLGYATLRELRNCVNKVELYSLNLFPLSPNPVPYKPYGYCGRCP